jgi:hypothetical protein
MTLNSYGGTLGMALAAAEELAGEQIEAEVVDLRTMRPLDDQTIMASVLRTHRAVVVDQGWRSGSLAAEVSAPIMEQAFYNLDAPVPDSLWAALPAAKGYSCPPDLPDGPVAGLRPSSASENSAIPCSMTCRPSPPASSTRAATGRFSAR